MKKYLLGLFIGLLGLSSFCFGDKVENLIDVVKSSSVSVSPSSSQMLLNLSPSDYGIYCLDISNYDAGGQLYTFLMFGRFSYPGEVPSAGNYLNIYDNLSLYCIHVNQPYIGVRNTTQYTISFDYDIYSLSDLLNTDIPVLSSSECQSEYDLIPISDVDQNYCVNNNLCPVNYLHIYESNGNNESSLISQDVNIYTSTGILVDSSASPVGDFYFSIDSDYGGSCELGSGNWSALYINGIQHESASLIDINIADYVPWDYSINDDVFDLDIGSGYDQDYIDGVIDVQSYRPTSEDFTQTFVGGLILFTPYIVILLFVILVWNLIKKIFKTK